MAAPRTFVPRLEPSTIGTVRDPQVTQCEDLCTLGTDYTITITANDQNTGSNGLPTPISVSQYVVFTAYSFNATTSVGGTCATTTMPAITLSSPFSVASPTYISPEDLQIDAEHLFINYLGVALCSTPPTAFGNLLNISTTYGGNRAAITISPAAMFSRPPSQYPTAGTGSASGQSTTSISQSQGLSTRKKATIAGVIVPVVCILLCLLTVFVWRRRQRRSAVKVVSESPKIEDTSQMYMQQKAELEDEERRRHELEAKERRYEIAGDAVHEMPAMTDGRVLRGKIQELKGEEFSRELQAQ